MQVRAYRSADVSAAKRAGAGMYGRTGRQGKSASVWFSRMLRKRYGVLSRRINACLPQCANPNAYRAEYEKCGGTGTPAFELIKGRMRQRTAKGKEIFPQGLTFNRQVVAKRLKSVKRARKNGKLSGMNGRCKKVETIGQEEAAPVGGAALWGFFGGSGLPLPPLFAIRRTSGVGCGGCGQRRTTAGSDGEGGAGGERGGGQKYLGSR